MENSISDDDILARIQAGDKSGCALCIEKYGATLYRLALRLMQNEKDAEDVVQETFLNALNAIDSFEGRSGLGTWLYRITYNNAMMRLRRPSTAIVSVEDTLENAEQGYAVPQQFFDWCCLPEEDFDAAEVRLELEQAIGELSPALSSTFILRELEGLSTRETAETLDVSEDVVKTRLRRARLQLREHLSAYFAEHYEPV
ncbi:MAG: RNA polymerase sigma factor [Candidatus Promineifilaceae bacterium]